MDGGTTQISLEAVEGLDTQIIFDATARSFNFTSIEPSLRIPIILRGTLSDYLKTTKEVLFDLITEPLENLQYVV